MTITKFDKLRENKEFFFSILIFIVSIIFLDLFSVCFLFSLIFVSYLNFARDRLGLYNFNKKKHGISSEQNSRLGGILIILFLFIFYILNSGFKIDSFSDNQNYFYIVILLFISFLGFADDVLGGAHYLLKLYFLFFSILILLLNNDIFLFRQTNVLWLDELFNYKFFSFFITLIIIIGFINASNMADGANGILSGISYILIYLLYSETENIFYLATLKLLLVFFLYNIFISRVYLGDSGSYFLGFIISTLSLFYYNISLISAGVLACILSYPSIEITFTIIRRLNIGQNPLTPDDRHLHNIIFRIFNKYKLNFFGINSLTGLIILTFFSLPGVIAYKILNTSFHVNYWYVFLIQVLIYFLMYFSLTKYEFKID